MVRAREPSEPVGTLPQSVRRDFSGIDYDEAMRRAREIVPILRERAQRSEDARMLIRENEQLLHESGLFRFHQPKAFGGMELPFVAVVDIPAELARGCASTAWSVGNVACHHWILGYYDPETQREVWDANPDALIASSIALAAGRGRKTPGGFIVNGRWPFSSAVDNSEWNMLAVTGFDQEGQKANHWRVRSGAEVRGRARCGRRRARAVPQGDGPAGGHLYRRAGGGFPGRADQGRSRALPDRLGARPSASVRHRLPSRRGA